MRIIAGDAKGRRLVAPQGIDTRPMTDRAKEALFSSLGSEVVDAVVLDLFAGSGSLGLEALSRGAATCVFVEQNRKSVQALRRNIAAVGLGGDIVETDVVRYLHGTAQQVDLAFVDPPFGLALASVESILEDLEAWLAPEAVVVTHRRFGEQAPESIEVLRLEDVRRYGDSELWRYRMGDR